MATKILDFPALAYGLLSQWVRRSMMEAQEISLEQPSFWQLIFLQSKVNGASYCGEQLVGQKWDWPKNTYLQCRLRYLRWCPSTASFADLNPILDYRYNQG